MVLSRIAGGCFVATLVSGTTSSARADPAPTAWPAAMPSYAWWDAALTVGAAGVTIAVYDGAHLASKPHWDGPVLLDGWTRDRLRVTSHDRLANVRKVSDTVAFTSASWVVADSPLSPLVRGSPELALHLYLSRPHGCRGSRSGPRRGSCST